MASAAPCEFQLTRRHMPELDVLRGVAILSVVLYHGLCWMAPHSYAHAWQGWVIRGTVFGWLGVNLFFILSGFLITGILLRAREKPDYYKNFYIKRALRILPALFVALIGAAILRLTSFGGLVVAILFLANYAASLGVNGTFPVLWSLSVEEHFYMLWPAIVHRLKDATIAAIAVALCVVEPVLRYISGKHHWSDPHGATHLVSDYLAVGALLALFAKSRYATRKNSLRLGTGLIAASCVMLAIGLPFGIMHRDNYLGDALQVVPFNLMFAGGLVLALALHLRVFAGMWTWPLRYLGDISYGLYLYHLLAFNLVVRALSYFGVLQNVSSFAVVMERFLLMSALAVGVAHISRRWLEQPFLNMKRHLSN